MTQTCSSGKGVDAKRRETRFTRNIILQLDRSKNGRNPITQGSKLVFRILKDLGEGGEDNSMGPFVRFEVEGTRSCLGTVRIVDYYTTSDSQTPLPMEDDIFVQRKIKLQKSDGSAPRCPSSTPRGPWFHESQRLEINFFETSPDDGDIVV